MLVQDTLESETNMNYVANWSQLSIPPEPSHSRKQQTE